jgi:acyl-[acyl-carrier-protein]-phospholipid O-acyltransferase/long-chain-fatty-acid--[acyl-carrier-protein] ligase
MIPLMESLVRFALRLLTRTLYRIEFIGAENLPERGPALIVANHITLIDGLFILAATRRPIRFIMDKEWSQKPIARWIFRALRVIPITTTEGPKQIITAIRAAAAALREGEAVGIFAEGEVTRTGQMLPFKAGFEKILRKAPPETVVVPVHLDRLWGSLFSFRGKRFFWKLPRRVFHPITVSIGKPLPKTARAFGVRQAVMELGTDAFPRRRDAQEPLHRGFLRTARRHPFRLALADSTGAERSYRAVVFRSVLLARLLGKRWEGQEMVGILLPPSAAGATVNLAALLAGRVPVNLNYTASAEALRSAAAQAGIRTVVTSRAFLEKVKIEAPGEAVILEDLTAGATPGLKLGALLASLFLPRSLLERFAGRRRAATLDDLATIVFSSGSTGDPKGVMLTHANILSNVDSLTQLYDPAPDDVVLGVLPFFHSFGFTATLWYPLIRGLLAVYHVNPFDALTVGRLVRKYGVTFLLGTPTFFQTYIRRCQPGDLGSIRYAVAGAEKLPDRVAEAFRAKFGIDPLEGYGCTECSPIVAVNSPDFRARGFRQVASKRGRIGHPVPGTSVRILDPDTLAPMPPGQPGLLLVRGPNVMAGYLGRPDLTAKAFLDGWYVTGDIARLEEDGFLQITDRLSRFSKIAGEMVPHGKVEEALQAAVGAQEQVLAVAGVADEKKGERLVVLHVLEPGPLADLQGKLGALGLPNLWVPSAECFHRVEAIPVLGTGKMDLRRVKELAASFEAERTAKRRAGSRR